MGLPSTATSKSVATLARAWAVERRFTHGLATVATRSPFFYNANVASFPSILMASLQGSFLIASPHLGDGNFNRSVVLMVKHDEDGAFGFVLNRPTGNTVAEVWK